MADLKIPNLNIKTDKYIFKKKLNLRIGLNSKLKFFNIIMPPFIAICSLILFSSIFIYFYNPIENEEKKELLKP